MAKEERIIKYPDAKQKYRFISVGPGQKIKDPYQWMENAESPLTKKYISNQNIFTKQIFSEFKFGPDKREEFMRIFKEYLECKKYKVLMPVGTLYFQFVNRGDEFKDVLLAKNKYTEIDGTVVIDTNTTDDVLTTFSFSPNKRLLAYALISKNTYTEVIRVLSLPDFAKMDDKVEASHTSITWHTDSTGFFYSNFTSDKHAIFFHRIGEKTNHLCVLIETNMSENHRFKTDMSHDGKYLFIYQTSIYYGNLFYFIRQHRRCIMMYTEVVQVAYKWGRYYKYVHNDNNRVIFLTNRRASTRKLVMADFHYKRAKCHCNWIELVSKLPNYVIEDAIAVAKDKVLVHYRPKFLYSQVTNSPENIQSDYFAIYRIYGGFPALHTIRIPLEAAFVTGIAGCVHSQEVFFILENYRNPGVIYRFELDDMESTPKPTVIYKNNSCFVNKERPRLFRKLYTSFDSKQIYVTFIYSQADLFRACRCLLTIHERFNHVLRPYYDPYMLAFIESFQGKAAIAHIRGGGEMGAKWHISATKHKKFRVIRDLLYITNSLMRDRITNRNSLAIRGVFHGGFAVAASANINPGLCKVAIIKNGILDLLAVNNHKAFAQEIMTEFGIPNDPLNGLKFLYGISPTHNIRFPICFDYYPATLVLVTPESHGYIQQFHSLKYIANLQDELTVHKNKKIPMLLRVEETANRLECIVDEFVFMNEFLGRN